MTSKAFSPSFFFATEAGAVCYADDLGHCSEVQQLTSPVDRLLFYEAARRLVIITRSLLMTQLQVIMRIRRNYLEIAMNLFRPVCALGLHVDGTKVFGL